MRIVVAIDSWKGTLTSTEAGEAVARGLASASEAEIDVVPVSDGGEGLVEAYRAARGGRIASASCRGPLGGRVTAVLLLVGEEAVIEMASSSGLPLVAESDRDPMRASSLGVGDQILAAIREGARSLVIGVGGSATCDGGAGMAAALGARFLDGRGEEVEPVGGGLGRIRGIDLSSMDPRVRRARIRVACDVDNPLVGPRGAARVFAPQKGAGPAEVEILEAGIENLAAIVERTTGFDMRSPRGGGAAGGLAAGLAAFCGADLAPGFETVALAIGLEEKITTADLVVTGEGTMDEQTLMGKLPSGVASLAARHGVPVVAFCGRARAVLEPEPFLQVHDLVSFAGSEESAMAGGADLVERLAAERAGRVLAASRKPEAPRR